MFEAYKDPAVPTASDVSVPEDNLRVPAPAMIQSGKSIDSAPSNEDGSIATEVAIFAVFLLVLFALIIS